MRSAKLSLAGRSFAFLRESHDCMQNRNHQGVYLALRQAVLTGRLGPGERVIETEVAERAGVSRTPVREAIHRLVSEGLLVRAQGRGVVVARIDEADLRDLTPVRATLEGLAVRLAAGRLGPEDLSGLRACVERGEAALQRGDAPGLNEANDAFHRLLVAAAGNRVLAETLSGFHLRVSLARARSLQIPWRPQDSLEEHRGICAALADGRADLAERRMVEHVMRAADVALSGSAEEEDAGERAGGPEQRRMRGGSSRT
jgi:DNA-binding GntR family transcriptional regulator